MTAAAAAAATAVMCAIMCVQMCVQKSTKRELLFQSFDCRTRCHLSDEGEREKKGNKSVQKVYLKLQLIMMVVIKSSSS